MAGKKAPRTYVHLEATTLIQYLNRANRKGFTDYAIAKHLHVSRQTISGVRNGRHGLSWQNVIRLIDLANGLFTKSHAVGPSVRA